MRENGKARIITYPVTREEAGMTVGDFLRKKAGFTKRQISRMKFRENGIVVNEKPARVSRILREGDVLRVCLSTDRAAGARGAETVPEDSGKMKRKETSSLPVWAPPPSDMPPLQILYQDEDLLIVNKPSGVVCHPGHGHFADTLMNQAVFYLVKKKERSELHLIGRLDRETSGIVVFTRSREAAQRLWRQRAQGIYRKTYLAEVEGRISDDDMRWKEEGRISDEDTRWKEEEPASRSGTDRVRIEYINEKENVCQSVTNHAGVECIREKSGAGGISDSGKSGVVIRAPIGRKPGSLNEMEVRPDGRPAETYFRVLREKDDRSLLEVRIRQGRTHQIRVHMAAAGHPVVGDAIYGSGEKKGEMHLCAYRAELRQPFEEKMIRLSAAPSGWK